jgi:glycosyltransferase involved in cell wall biosynthesis
MSARLAMAGGPMTPALQAVAQKHQLGSALLEVAAPSNEQLQALYSGALASLFPSLEEGFGWPILESQACGCPVVIADRRPMTDVAGGAAILIDPSKPVAAAQTIAGALKDTARLRADGLRNAASYTTDRMLERCEALYEKSITAKRAQG